MTPEQLINRLRLTIAPVKITLVDDSQTTQLHQVDLGPQSPEGSLGIHDNVPALAFFGFVSNPPIGSDGLVLHIGGDRSNGVVVGHNHPPSRKTGLAPGDAGVHDVRGAFVLCLPGGPVIDAAGGNVTIQNAANVTITGSTKVTITAPTVNIDASSVVNIGGAGGPAVARVGDQVNLSTGLIETGSSKVNAV